MSAVCVLALAFSYSVAGAAQTSSDAAKTAKAKAANPKKHHTAAANAAGTAPGPGKKSAHPASHPPAASHPKSNTAKAKHSSRKHKRTARGQQKIDSDRAQEIQEALIREHYLSGDASGKWTQASEDAMRRYQADHGWQSKTVPDSRALISLGLGPSKAHLLNPESAMTTVPDRPRGASSTTSPAASAVTSPANAPVTPAKSPDPTPVANPDHSDSSSPQ